MTKHTPGPWVNHGCYIYRTGTDGKRTGPAIANTRVDEFISPEEEESNARLIGASPDLYDAAENALNALVGCCVPAGGVDDRKTILEAQTMLRAAIAKATGEQQ
jgi:hypothetical protein